MATIPIPRCAIQQISDHADVYAANAQIIMHARCGRMQAAREAFDRIKHPDVVSWTALILGYATNGEAEAALCCFARMPRQGGCTPSARTFVAALKACTNAAEKCGADASRERGTRLHALALRNGHHLDIYVQSALVNMYSKVGSMVQARKVFDSIEHPNVVCWNVIILGYAENGNRETALDLFSRMGNAGCAPDWNTFFAAMTACIDLATDGNVSAVQRGKMLHLLASECGCDLDSSLKNALVDMYAKCGSMIDSRRVFNSISIPNVVSWTALIMGYARNGDAWVALELFSRMVDEGCAPNARTFVAAAKACCELANQRPVKKLHLMATQSGFDADVYVQAGLVDMYVKCGLMENARGVFDSMRHPPVVCWNVLIMGYAHNGQGEAGLDLFLEMRREGCVLDSRTFVSALKACIDIAEKGAAKLASLVRTKKLHLLALEHGCDVDIYVQVTLMDMYGKAESMVDSRCVFERLKEATVVCWNALVMGYVENGEATTALELFSRMRRQGCEPNARTFVAALKAFTDLVVRKDAAAEASREMGRRLHLLALRSGFDDLYVMNILVDFYAKCGSMSCARETFDSIKQPDVVCWNALLLGYAENGEGEIPLDLFLQMKHRGCAPDVLTYVALLKACTLLGALETGEGFHAEINRSDFRSDPMLASCLVDFYAKCGSLHEAKQVFDSVSDKSLVSWTVLMTGYSSHEQTSYVFDLFEKMLDSGLQPDEIIFNCLLTTCSRAGLVNEGKSYLDAMSRRFGLTPNIEHCNCVIDMFSRANQLDEAMATLRSMVYSPNDVTWITVLGGCKKSKNVALGKLAFESLTSFNKDGAYYVLMSNIWREQGSRHLGHTGETRFSSSSCSNRFTIQEGSAVSAGSHELVSSGNLPRRGLKINHLKSRA